MSETSSTITPEISSFIEEQQMFWVASAPLSSLGHINLSPKGLDSFRIIEPNLVGYLDLAGSGNETSAHILENGRITLMFCSFGKNPKILRIYGSGRVILPTDQEWGNLIIHFKEMPGTRQLILAEVIQIQTSCGFGVPFYSFEGQRRTLFDWADKKGEDGLKKYIREKNSRSIDGLPARLPE